jgi:hypothetical protein
MVSIVMALTGIPDRSPLPGVANRVEVMAVGLDGVRRGEPLGSRRCHAVSLRGAVRHAAQYFMDNVSMNHHKRRWRLAGLGG